jgi:hypothetical protein
MDKSAASKEKKSRSKMMIVRSKYYKRCKQLLIPEVTPTRCPDVWGFWVLCTKAHPNLPYAKFLKNIAHTTIPGPRVGFQVSPQVVMDSYILHLRGTNIGDKLPGRFNKYNAMVTRVGMISGTFMEFWIEGGLVKSSKAITLLNYYKEEDKVIHAKVLELGSDLPVLCRTVFQLLELFRNNEKHVASGARVLSTIGVVGWTSCMTKYTPKYKDGSLPKDDED